MSAISQHVDPETLASFAEGRLDAVARGAVIAHLDGCEECMNDVALVMPAAAHAAEARRFGGPRTWLLSLAAALALALALPAIWHALHRSPIDSLVALAPRSARIVEPRLTGGFAWAGYHGPNRAADSATNAQQLKLGGAAGDLIERAEHDASPDAQHAAGLAMVLVEKPDEAIARLETAARASNDAKTWSDLAAARYATASKLGRASLYPEALAATDAALRIDAILPEALFNRALILEKMGLTQEARRAWQRYLNIDATSAWATEARNHLAELPATTGSSRFERDKPLLERAAAAGDARRTGALVDAYRESSRALAEVEYLGLWAEAEQRKDATEAARWLTISRAIGNALTQLSGESLLRDAVRTIDTAAMPSRSTIAEAHATYRRGRMAYSRHQIEPGEQELRHAAELFQSVGDPMSLMARHYAASAMLARNEITAARGELEQLRADADLHPSYLALGAHARWELARAGLADGDRSSQIPIFTAAAELFRRGGERASEAFVETQLSATLTNLGREDEAWSERILAFRALSAEGLYDLLETSVAGIVATELKAGRRDAALALSTVAQSMLGADSKALPAIGMLVQKAMLESVAGNDAEAVQTIRRADAIAAGLSDRALRARVSADIDVTRGALLLSSDSQSAAATLTRAIDFYRSCQRTSSLPEPLLLRARCALRTGQTAAAARDLEDGIQAVEHNPMRVEGVALGTGVLDAGNALFAEAIRANLDRGDIGGAFAYAERSRGDTITIGELQHRLGTSGTAVLEVISLQDEVVAFAISRNDAQASRHPLASAKLISLAERNAAGDDHAAATLYDIVIRPFASVIARASALVIIPDQRLAGVPFAALRDSTTKQYLIEKLPLAIAFSAASLRYEPSSSAMRSVVEVALPFGSASGSAELPDSEKEMADVAAVYPRSLFVPSERATWAALRVAAASADVVHIAGHTERQPGGGEQALLFADASGGVERIAWKTIIANPPLKARVIVLAACETLRAPASPQTRALSLGAAFSAGGADVIGTLMPIPDRDARVLFRSVHRQLAAGASALAALRTAQEEAIRNEAKGGGTRAWRAIAVLTIHIPH